MKTSSATIMLFISIFIQQSIEKEDLDQLTESQEPFFHVPLDHGGKLELFWDVYYDTETVVMEIHAQATPDDWLAVGFSDDGEIENADLCVFWVDRKGKTHFMDTWTDRESVLHVDKHQNCHLAKLSYLDGVRVLVWRRQFDTCEVDDYVIQEGTTHVVYAMGEGPLPGIEGVKLQQKEHGFQRTQLLKNESPVPPLPADVKTLTFVNNKVSVPGVETTYWCSLHKMPLLSNKHHIVQFEAVIQPGNEALVHHMELFHCEIPVSQKMDDYSAACTAESKPPHYEACKKVLAAWAMGALPIRYPKEAGAPIGGPEFSQYVMLEIHYNNPGLKNDWIDSSGIQFHYTSQLRKHDVGVMELGLEYTPKMAIPPRQHGFTLHGHCIPECTEKAIPPSGIIVFASQLHTHLTGVRVTTRHIRGGIELALLNGDNHYSPHFQEIRILKTPTLVLPGDGLITSCTYKTSDRANITVGGFSITDEMCVNYIHYYPKIDLELCKSSIDTGVLENYFDFMNEYENQPTSNEKDVTTNYHSINWNPLRSQMLNDFYEVTSLAMHCNQSNGESFPVIIKQYSRWKHKEASKIPKLASTSLKRESSTSSLEIPAKISSKKFLTILIGCQSHMTKTPASLKLGYWNEMPQVKVLEPLAEVSRHCPTND